MEWGLAPVISAARIIDTDLAAIQWNRQAMENRGGSDFLISPKNGEILTEKQYNALKEAVQTGLQGASNARKVFVTNGAVELTQLNMNAIEMDFIRSLDSYKNRICSCFKTPAPLITFDQSGGSMSNNLSPIFLFYWMNTVMPMMFRMCESFEQTLLPYYKDDTKLRIVPDYSGVPSLQAMDLDTMKICIGYLQQGVPIDELIKAFKLPFPLGMKMNDAKKNPSDVDRLHNVEDNTQTGLSKPGGSVPVDGVIQ
jgi:HK97 family phage portal protein